MKLPQKKKVFSVPHQQFSVPPYRGSVTVRLMPLGQTGQA